MESVEARVAEVRKSTTRNGNTRYAVVDDEGREYSTFRPRIGEEAAKFEGRRARIRFHEEERNGFTNVYLDAIEPAGGGGQEEDGAGRGPDEAGWATAVEAAPWLTGTAEPKRRVDPDDLYEKLEPFKQRVAEDIRRGGEDDGDDDPAS